MFDKAFVKNLSKTGENTGPGPHINIRNVSNEKVSSTKTTLALEPRAKIFPGTADFKMSHHRLEENPGPAAYRVPKNQQTVRNCVMQRSQ